MSGEREKRVYNFAAGPSMLPEEVLRTAQSQLLNYMDSGMSVMELTHRGALFQDIFDAAQSKLRAALSVPDSHEILFLQGGGTLQFAAIPMNLMENGKADYAVTGAFSGYAAQEAQKYGTVNIAFATADTGHDRIPPQSDLKLSDDAKYFYYCANNTIFGTAWPYVPETSSPLVCDMSSEILSKSVDVSKFGLIFAGAQKNMAPAGLTVVIVDKALTGRETPITPKVMSYAKEISSGSMLNTPPCWCIYMLSLTLDYLERMGGVKAMEQLKKQRSAPIYEFLDNSRLFTPHAKGDSRSDMNITFRTPSPELDGDFVRGAAEKGMMNLKGHRLVGGIRASLYNAMPLEGAAALLDYMKDFEVKHHV